MKIRSSAVTDMTVRGCYVLLLPINTLLVYSRPLWPHRDVNLLKDPPKLNQNRYINAYQYKMKLKKL